jgi:SAM-dependent methyltransferase
MEKYDESTYGDRIAEVYDEMASSYEEACIETLYDLAKEGPALELGIGTGRIALPLHHKGIEVHGIDSSQKMLEKLQSKPGGKNIPVTIGDFGEVPVKGQYSLIFVVFNTFYALPTQEEQIHCFQNVPRHLKPGGVFLIDAFVPDLARFTDHQTFRVVKMDVDQVNLDANQHDPVKQQITSQHILITNEGIQLFPVKIRYAWPTELDLMARLAGLDLRHRWGDWERGPFTAKSGRHISVYS